MKYVMNFITKIESFDSKKKTIIGILLIIGIVSTFLMCKSFLSRNNTLDEVILKGGNNDNGMFAIMLEQADGTYSPSGSNKWPTDDEREYDEAKSGCIDSEGNELSNVLSYDEVNRIVKVRTNKAAHCFIYFSYPIPDISINVSTDGDSGVLPSTTGYKSTLTCDGTDIKYNPLYDRYEFSSITAPYTCTLNYEKDTDTDTDKVYFNDYIINLAEQGEDQGTGKVVHETVYGNYTNLTQSQYVNYSTDSSSAAVWIESQSAWSLGSAEYVEFNVPVDGYYNFCNYRSQQVNYNISHVSLYIDDVFLNELLVSVGTQCIDVGYLESSSIIKLLQGTGGTSYYDTKYSGYAYLQLASTYYDTGYRYQGTNPNNYVVFNNELWRIVGVFNTTLSDGTTDNLVKLIKWNITSDEINVKYDNMIENVVWHLGSMMTSSSNSTNENYYYSRLIDWYRFERSDIVHSSLSPTKTSKYERIYGSDFGYSVLASDYDRSNKFYNNNVGTTSVWYQKSWISNGFNIPIITPDYENGYSDWNLPVSGTPSRGSDKALLSVYLKSNVHYVSGSGSLTNPYIIDMVEE